MATIVSAGQSSDFTITAGRTGVFTTTGEGLVKGKAGQVVSAYESRRVTTSGETAIGPFDRDVVVTIFGIAGSTTGKTRRIAPAMICEDDGISSISEQAPGVAQSVVLGAGLRAPTGYDQANEIEQYFNDTGGAARGAADFGAGTYIIGRPIIIRHTRKDPHWTGISGGSSGIGYGLRMSGISPGETVLQYTGNTGLTDADGNLRPAILITTPNNQPSPYKANRDYLSLIEGFQLVCAPGGVRNPVGTVSGSGIEFRPESAAIRASDSPAAHTQEMRRIIIDGFAYGLSLYDATLLKIDRVWWQDFLIGLRLGYNCDLIKITQSMFGMEGYGVGAGTDGAGHRLGTIAIQDGWTLANAGGGSYSPPGNANCFELDHVWVREIDQFMVLTANEQGLHWDHVYLEAVAQYLSASAGVGKLVLDLTHCHFSNPSAQNLAWNDARVATMSVGNGYGAKIDVACSSSVITMRHCTSDTVLAPPGGYIRYKTGGDVNRLVMEGNDLSAGARGHLFHDDGAGTTQTRTLPNRANGTYTFGGWLGLSRISGQEITPDGKAVGAYTQLSAGTVVLDHNVADSFSYTLPTSGTVTFTTAGGYPPDGLRIKLRLKSPASGSCTIAFSGYFAPDTITQFGSNLGARSYLEFECVDSRMFQVSPPNKWVA